MWRDGSHYEGQWSWDQVARVRIRIIIRVGGINQGIINGMLSIRVRRTLRVIIFRVMLMIRIASNISVIRDGGMVTTMACHIE